MSDIAAVTAEFLDRVDRQAPDEAKRVRAVLDTLLRWGGEHGEGLSLSGRAARGQVRYCAGGVEGAVFWALAPRAKDGARLTLLADHPRFPGGLREEARALLARIDGRAAVPDETPSVGFGKLLWAPYRDAVLGLMTRAVRQVCPAGDVVTA